MGSPEERRQTTARIRAYMAALSPRHRKRLKELGDAIRAAAPTAEPGFGYGIPGVRLLGRPLVYYAAFKEHVSMYPISRAFEKAHAEALRPYGTSGRGTLRFPLDAPIPRRLVALVVRDRLKAARATERAKRARR
ncbi:MAG: DUF1801 domain-containing protein [Gemmatimonadetes bacterium]|nr:DUF1801 domain-containing protein [Gemmatimonadota bacterium]